VPARSRPRPSPGVPAHYAERLAVPWTWWALAAVAVLSVWWAYAAATGPAVAFAVAAAVAVAATALLVGVGRVRVGVGPDGLRAGRARLPLWAVGRVAALDADAARALRGPEADARAYLVLRGYVPGGVRVDVTDPDDPTPYWLVSSRHPDQLAEALRAEVVARFHPG
jgi:Protein of unknown function (DUF3093)